MEQLSQRYRKNGILFGKGNGIVGRNQGVQEIRVYLKMSLKGFALGKNMAQLRELCYP